MTRYLRQRSQGLVEFGLSVAVVALVAVTGFGALSRAQGIYWGGTVQTSLAQPTPAPGDFIHPTQVTGSCTPPPFVYATASNSFTCSVAVTDAWPTDRSAPRGHVAIAIDGTTPLSPACTLTPDAGGQPLSTCNSFTETWTPAVADGVHSLVVQYTQDVSTDLGKHAASSLTTSQITVLAPVTIQFVKDSNPGHTSACWNPLSIFANPDQFEVGHPEICHLTVTDLSGHGIASTAVQVTDTVPVGDPGQGYFSCYTNNQISALATCNNPGTPFIGNTDANGELWFVYRRYYDALGGTVPVGFTATMLAYPPNPPSTPKNVTVAPVVGPHNTDMVVDCPSPPGTVTGYFASVAGNGQSVLSADHMSGAPGTQVTCTVVVFDSEQPFFAPFPPSNPDTEYLFAPAGTVAFLDVPSGTPGVPGAPVNDPSGKPARCTLSIGNSLPALKPLQLHGLPSDAASCSAQLLLSVHQTIIAQFTPSPPPIGHAAVSSHPFDADFDVH